MGGERGRVTAGCAAAIGSSPRGRGTLIVEPVANRCNRFIPAWAGNAAGSPVIVATSTVHPRVGGERLIAKNPLSRMVGSSPRGRGTLTSGHVAQLLGRFIPAWAGNAT